ncbi:ComEC/Rec2 family competence protein [Flavobacterium subsaxonicum]|uniref:ComEC/Rec2 family competence protein n=1 Tax=Flavobacterium subsaxonicum TaxID=426226 RepID=UPI000687EDE7|nr:ComEC/Rec2 family competence protein [Flavobacterium subsaxonicum]
MTVLKYPVIPFTLFIALGILAGYYLQPGLPLLYSICFIALLLLAATYFKANKTLIPKPYFGFAAILFAFIAGMGLQQLHYSPNYITHYSHFLKPDATPVIKGVITERLKPNEFSEKYYFEVEAIDKQLATGRLLITVPKDSVNKLLHAGDVLFIADEPQPITPALNPYQFDYAVYMQKQDVFHQLKLKNNYVKAGIRADFNHHIQNFRARLISSFAIHNYSAQTMNIINALLFGQRQDMDKETADSYTNAGVVHILAISGLHFSLLFFALNWMLGPLKRLRHCYILHFTIIVALMWFFALITGLSASVVRAVVMFSFVLTGTLINRKANIYNSLAVSMLVLLLAKPNFLFDAGFQLSYIAVFAIVWLQNIYNKLGRSKYWIVNFGRDTVAISLIAQIGVLPLSLYYFNQFPLLFLVANVIVIPLSNIILGLGILTLLLNFIFPPLAIWVGKLLELLIVMMNGFIKWVASFQSLLLKDIPFTLLLNLALYLTLVMAVLWLYKQSYKRTAALLCTVLLFQLTYMATAWQAKHREELVVFHNYNNTLVAQKNANTVTVMSNDSLATISPAIKAYSKGSFNPAIKTMPLQNLLWYKGHTILIIDSSAAYLPNVKPEVLLLTQSPKLNLERVLQQLQPKQVIADATNYKTYIARWEATCQKQKIPFYATHKKGSYILR